MGLERFVISIFSKLHVNGLSTVKHCFYIGMSQTLNDEISHLGLRSICIDYGWFRIAVLENTQRTPRVERIPDCKPIVDRVEAFLESE